MREDATWGRAELSLSRSDRKHPPITTSPLELSYINGIQHNIFYVRA